MTSSCQRTLVDILSDHCYLAIGRKCDCGHPCSTRQLWAAHVRDEVAFENALDEVAKTGVNVREALDVLDEGLQVVRDGRESGNPNDLIFASGFLAGAVQRACELLTSKDSLDG